jgi:hypothetical protein
MPSLPRRSCAAPSAVPSISRRGCSQRLAVLSLTALWLPPAPPALASDIDTAIALAPVLLLKSAISDVDEQLLDGLLQGQPAIAAGIPMERAADTVALVTKLLKEYSPREQARQAADTAMRAKLLSRREAGTAATRAREAQELLAGILEFDAADARKKDLMGNLNEVMRADAVRFYHLSLVKAQQELDAAVDCFGAEERVLTAKLARGALGNKAGVPPPPSVEREREAAVLRAIEALPGPGAALTRGDLQNALDNKWRETNGAQQVKAG